MRIIYSYPNRYLVILCCICVILIMPQVLLVMQNLNSLSITSLMFILLVFFLIPFDLHLLILLIKVRSIRISIKNAKFKVESPFDVHIVQFEQIESVSKSIVPLLDKVALSNGQTVTMPSWLQLLNGPDGPRLIRIKELLENPSLLAANAQGPIQETHSEYYYPIRTLLPACNTMSFLFFLAYYVALLVNKGVFKTDELLLNLFLYVVIATLALGGLLLLFFSIKYVTTRVYIGDDKLIVQSLFQKSIIPLNEIIQMSHEHLFLSKRQHMTQRHDLRITCSDTRKISIYSSLQSTDADISGIDDIETRLIKATGLNVNKDVGVGSSYFLILILALASLVGGLFMNSTITMLCGFILLLFAVFLFYKKKTHSGNK